jgi:NADPH:quinone reductase-like Zn-dependent oxidoreductase
MKAAQIREYGSAEVVKIVEIDKPVAGAGQVLIAVKGSSINPFDRFVREGNMKAALSLPVTLGGDVAGDIIAIGTGVSGFAIGDAVYGQANAVAGNSGAFAEFAATKAAQVGRKPANLDYTEAAAIALTGVSAWQVLLQHMALQTGQKILIHGGAGGIGTAAIQIAKHRGAYVATTATGEGLDYVKQLGADQVIDYKAEKFDDVIHDFDAVFDTVAGETYDRSFAVLKPGGIIVSMNAQPNEALASQHNVRAVLQSTKVTTEALGELRQLIESKVVTVHVERTFPLDQIQAAFKAWETGTVKGKIGLTI